MELNGHPLSRMNLDEVNKLLESLPSGDVQLKVLKAVGSEQLSTRIAVDNQKKQQPFGKKQLLDKTEKEHVEDSLASSLSGASVASDELGEYLKILEGMLY